jgi:hypothetical protein
LARRYSMAEEVQVFTHRNFDLLYGDHSEKQIKEREDRQ